MRRCATARRRLVLLGTLSLVLAKATSGPAQEVKAGSRVRVTLYYHPSGVKYRTMVGAITGAGEDTLTLTLVSAVPPDSSRRVSLTLTSIRRFELSVARPPAIKQGALYGAGVGVLAGSAIGALTRPTSGCVYSIVLQSPGMPLPQDERCETGRTVTGQAFLGAGVGALVGAMVGQAVGGLLRVDRWRPVSFLGIRLSTAPAAGRMRLGAALSR